MLLTPIGSATIESVRDIMLLRNLINPRLLNTKFLFNLGCGVEVGDGSFVPFGTLNSPGLLKSVSISSFRNRNLYPRRDALSSPHLR